MCSGRSGSSSGSRGSRSLPESLQEYSDSLSMSSRWAGDELSFFFQRLIFLCFLFSCETGRKDSSSGDSRVLLVGVSDIVMVSSVDGLHNMVFTKQLVTIEDMILDFTLGCCL